MARQVAHETAQAKQVKQIKQAEQPAEPSPQKKVLVIDDNPTIVELIRHAVNMQGKYSVIVAYDGVQGLEQFYNEHPDCVIVDVRMPRMDGYQVVRCIRGDTVSAHTPLIILSAMIEEDDQLTGLLSGVDEYLAKPFKPSVLCATLERVMQITPEEREHRIERLAVEDLQELHDEVQSRREMVVHPAGPHDAAPKHAAGGNASDTAASV